MKFCHKCSTEKPKSEFHKHTRAKDGLNSCCKACNYAQVAAWRKANPEKQANLARAYYKAHQEACSARAKAWKKANPDRVVLCGAEYYKANREKISARSKAYSAENADKISARMREYYVENAERIAERSRAYYLENSDSCVARSIAWQRDNPEKRSAIKRNRRARLALAEGTHTAADIKAIFDNQRGLCANCKKKMFKSGAKKFHIDHIMPLSKGGSNDKHNLQCLCPECNLRKNAKDPLDWAKEQGRLL